MTRTCAVYIGIDTGKKETYYRVRKIEGGYGLKTKDGAEYHVRNHKGRWSCDCADATFKQHQCKHCKAVQKQIEMGILKEIT